MPGVLDEVLAHEPGTRRQHGIGVARRSKIWIPGEDEDAHPGMGAVDQVGEVHAGRPATQHEVDQRDIGVEFLECCACLKRRRRRSHIEPVALERVAE